MSRIFLVAEAQRKQLKQSDKIVNIAKRARDLFTFVENHGFKWPFPRRIQIIQKLGFDVVHGCQLRCIGCSNSTLAPKIFFISIGDFASCLANIDVKHVKLFRLFNFGEALLHPELIDILLQLPKQKWSIDCVEISTNAQLHDFDKVKEILKTGILCRMVVSCDGDGTVQEYERLRPPAKWPKLIEFLRKTKELRDAYAPEVELMTRTICENEEGRNAWKKLLDPLGWTPEFRGWLTFPYSSRALSEEKPLIKNRVCSYMIRKRYLYVDADGTVVPCCMHPKACELGNLKLTKYNDIIRGMAYTQFIKTLKTKRIEHKICGSCKR